MPIPSRKQNEDPQKYVSRCMGNETMKKEYPDQKQRVAICLGQTRTKKSKGNLLDQVLEILGFSLGCDECVGYEEDISCDNIVIPNDEDYMDCDEDSEEYESSESSCEDGSEACASEPATKRFCSLPNVSG